MASSETKTETPDAEPAVQLVGQTYEIIRNRLTQFGKQLRERLQLLNDDRKEVFGSIETALLGTERVTTTNNCLPRDMISIGDYFLFGYNVRIGLRKETALKDVFAVYNAKFQEQSISLIDNKQFEIDFHELYKYYKHTTFAKFSVIGHYLFMVFRVGRQDSDIKTFKWLLEDDKLIYEGNRSDHEFKFPPQHEFEWKRTTRDMHQAGLHPHISIEEKVFVETIGGDLTIKIEDNTETGKGIYSGPVENPDQTLDDAEIYYAIIGEIILLKIRPYQESDFRYIVYSSKVQQAKRIDAIAESCVLLPESHGLIFPQGYYLQTGEYKTFDTSLEGMLFEKLIRSPNGEDFLYVFFNRKSGTYVLLSYNIISQIVQTPMICSGYSLFDNGEFLTFRVHEEVQKHHAIQRWQTPFTAHDFEASEATDSFLYKVGNKDIVRGMAECHEVLGLIAKEDSYANLYLDLAKLTGSITDAYFWMSNEEVHNLSEVLLEIHEASQAAVSEFEKVERVRRNTKKELARVETKTEESFDKIKRSRFDTIEDFVVALSGLRAVRGEIVSLRDMQYVDLTVVDRLEAKVAESSDKLANKCVEFLLKPDALKPYEERIAKADSNVSSLTTVAETKTLGEEVDAAATELEMLIEIVSNLKIDDATQRTAIIDNISALFAGLNKTRAGLKNKLRSLASSEGAAEFASQLKLLDQAVVNYLDICETPEKCEEYLTKLMIQIEELEARFSEFDEMIEQIGQKREEIYNAFEAQRLRLVEAKNRRASTLEKSADRILKGIASRIDKLETVDEIHGYFAADLMVDKVRDIVSDLEDLNDTVKVGDIQSRLKTVREEAIRQLKDRNELFVDGKNVIQFGKHRFTVNTQKLDLTTVFRDGTLNFHLTGTDYFEPITNEKLLETKPVWDQELISENKQIYRAEYLAYQMLQASGLDNIRSNKFAKPIEEITAQAEDVSAENQLTEPKSATEKEGSKEISPEENSLTIAPKANQEEENNNVPTLQQLAKMDDTALLSAVQKFMAPRYAEGYIKGVHDHDGAMLLKALVQIVTSVGLLRFSPKARTLAWLFWKTWNHSRKPVLAARLAGFGEVTTLFPKATLQEECIAELQMHIAKGGTNFFWGDEESTDPPVLNDPIVLDVGEYLFHAIVGEERFVISGDAVHLCQRFRDYLDSKSATASFEQSLETIHSTTQQMGFVPQSETDASLIISQFLLARDWIAAYLNSIEADKDAWLFADEAALLLIQKEYDASRVIGASLLRKVDGLIGSHSRIENAALQLNFNEFNERLLRFQQFDVAAFMQFQALKHALTDARREELRLEEFRPRVLTSFVRNRLIDHVYMPMIGDNLAKQIGSAGEETRTDRMGLLLLISPPGYGKTTLMEYLANRLGLVFMKINGPAIGHGVKSLDPEEAPNAAAREEVEKLNLALEMGDNVMLYLDDIQHVHAEFLQKFISLCDATRKIEGVFKGKTRTYDLRGKKVCVVMAGNPYTESGERFQIPDMLANRADTYNIGEIIGDNSQWFEMSYLENSMTSNDTLSRVASRNPSDVYAFIQLAEGEGTESVELQGNYAMDEREEIINVMRKMIRVRNVVLAVNREYIRSAGQADDYRTEPAFKLQGSYRNMNRIAERISAVMNDAELESLILSQYEQDSQTLTNGAESNLLKFKDLIGIATEEETKRWDNIKRTFRQNQKLHGVDSSDKLGQVIAQMGVFSDGLQSIEEAVVQGTKKLTHAAAQEETEKNTAAQKEAEHLDTLIGQLGDFKTGLLGIQQSLDKAAIKIGKPAAKGKQTIQTTFAPEAAELLTKFIAELQLAAASTKQIVPVVPSPNAAASTKQQVDHQATAQQDTGSGSDPFTEGIHHTPATDDQPYRVEVINRVPRLFLSVIREQFKLMQSWMEPLMKTANKNTVGMKKLRKQLDEAMASYEQLSKQLQQGE